MAFSKRSRSASCATRALITTSAKKAIIPSFEQHALKAGVDNPMSYCNYLEPGLAGTDMLWDFSELKFEKSFTGYLNNSGESELGSNYLDADTELKEFSSNFYFKVSEDQIEQYGYSSANGNVQTFYSTPFVKMKYPFEYLR